MRAHAVRTGLSHQDLTALLLAELAATGVVSYDDPVQARLPPAAVPRRVPDPPVTLLDLATHSGGLPRLPPDFHRHLLPGRMSDPYAGYGLDDLHRATARLRPGRREVRYSTYGMGLLGQLLADAAGCDYVAAVTGRVLRPLGMTGTGVPGAPGGPLPDRLATGHRRGRAVQHWGFSSLAGAGALYSTGADLLRLLRAHLDPGATPLANSLLATHRPHRPFPRGANSMALGWNHRVARGHTVLWHSGGTGGFTAWLGFSPDGRAGAAVLANAAPTRSQPVVRAGRRLLAATLRQASGD
ncbi:serine hydrolase domain-containing protein [Streptomyces sp. NPDC047097]|uniref:serine hydrolase domain-containing protein n=1 Tax=Streptomyces sp. NPDC047097 TaxID=3155260 RepID=UPI0033CE2E25